MTQEFLTNRSIIAIKWIQKIQDQYQSYYLGNTSIIRNQIVFLHIKREGQFENCLFQVQKEGEKTQTTIEIQFQAPVFLRHKHSSKYLSFSTDIEEDDLETAGTLKLSQHPCCFKFVSCFQYQKKYSNRIRFSENVYLTTYISSLHKTFLSIKQIHNYPPQLPAILELNQKQKLTLHCYDELKQEQAGFAFGQTIWLTHSDSQALLIVKQHSDREEIAFQPFNGQKEWQSIQGLWLISSETVSVGGALRYNQQFNLKNLCNDKYLTLSEDFRLINSDKTYDFILTQKPNQYSKFVFQSLEEKESQIKKKSCLIFKHVKTQTFIGTRQSRTNYQDHYLPALSFDLFEQADIFTITEITPENQETFRFIFALKKQLKYISKALYSKLVIAKQLITQIHDIYSSILDELTKLSQFSSFSQVQQQSESFINEFFLQIQQYHKQCQLDPFHSQSIQKLIQVLYSIMKTICKTHGQNQSTFYQYQDIFAKDIFLHEGAEQLLIQMFKNNFSFLSKLSAPRPQLGNKNTIQFVFSRILESNIKEKNDLYWKKILKILDLFDTVLYYNEHPIDINQRLLLTYLFEQKMLNRIFIEIKGVKQRIKIKHPIKQNWTEIDLIKEPLILTVVERLFKLFSSLCEGRNFIGKTYINQYLCRESATAVQITINYINIPISPNLENHLCSFITNCYIDSAPRINRKKPLPVILFNIDKDDSQLLSDGQKNNELSVSLLNKQKHYKGNPIILSNLLTSSHSHEPNLTQKQLNIYLKQLDEKIDARSWTKQVLNSICTLIRLDSYTTIELINIKNTFEQQIIANAFTSSLLPFAMKALQELRKYTEQMEIKKVTAYLKFKYSNLKKHTLDKTDIKMVLPDSAYIQTPTKHSHLSKDQKIQMLSLEVTHQFRQEYNSLVSTLQSFYPKNNFKNYLLNLFVSSQLKDFDTLSSLFKQLSKIIFPKLNLLKLLSKSIVIAGEEIKTFEKLYDLSKTFTYLNSISEYWLQNHQNQSLQLKQFIDILRQLTNFMFQDYDLFSHSHQHFRRNDKININRQLLLQKLNVHSTVLSFIDTNFYLLEQKHKIMLPNSHKQIFKECFQFLIYFCQKCRENQNTMKKHIKILQKVRASLEVGQTKLLIMIYKANDSLVKQATSKIIQAAITKIIKNNNQSHPQPCQYNPEYVQFLIDISFSKEKPFIKNISLIQKALENQNTFKSFLFLQQKQLQERFALSLHHYQKQPLKLPFLYHKQIIKLMCILIQNLATITTTALKNRLKKYLNLESIFHLLSLPDIYSHDGIISDLNFLVKKELFLLLSLYLQKNDLISQIYNSTALQSFLDHLIQIFLVKSYGFNRIQENQEVMLSYLEDYKKQLKYDRQNQRDFYQLTARPLLEKLYNIFEKIGHPENLVNFKKLTLLLQDVRLTELSQDHLLKSISYGMEKINLKWKNFVDTDQNNSSQQKFAKKMVLQLLKNEETSHILKNEKEQFYQLLATKQNQYFHAINQLIRIISEQQSQKLSEETQLTFYESIKQLTDYLKWNYSKGNHLIDFPSQSIIKTLLCFTTKKTFSYNNQLSRKIFYETLRIFGALLSNDQGETLQKVFYNYFKIETSSYRFFGHLNSALTEALDRIEKEDIHQQIDFALDKLTLCGDQSPIQIDKQALKFISLLCKYCPFTIFFRTQPYANSIDFLQKISQLFYIIIKTNQLERLSITIGIIDIIEPLLDCMIWMLNGCNEKNQQYIINTKFSLILIQILSQESNQRNNKRINYIKRDLLFEQVVAFYESNGINIKEQLAQNLKLLDFRHNYLLNRLKLAFLKVLHQCALANENVQAKIKKLIPVQLFKINLIWTYTDCLRQRVQYSQDFILRPRENWRQVIRKDTVQATFLMTGFYYFVFIQSYAKEEKESITEDSTEIIHDENKQKERVVKKFFSSISDSDSKAEKQKLLENQQLYKEMLRQYKIYYAACKFYKQKIVSIQANVYGKLTQIYFPLLPFCNRLTEKLKDKLIDQAVRINHGQKIKSLLNYEEQTYSILNGEQEYAKKLEENHSNVATALKLIQNQETIFIVIWIVSCIILVIYTLYDFVSPFNSFTGTVFYFLRPTNFLSSLIMILSLIIFSFGILILLNLFFKKIPSLKSVLISRYQKTQKKLQQANQQKFHFKNTLIYYLVSNYLSNLILDFYIMIFCILTIVHPQFAIFELLYIVSKISLGQQIFIAIKETSYFLLATTALLVMLNYAYTVFTYVAFTTDQIYGKTCKNLFKCFLLVLDQSLKGGAGFTSAGNVKQINSVVTFKLICQICYWLFVQKVIFQIFSGTIIDKFSQLRQKSNQTDKDEKSKCYICDLQRFQIDFELQGFQEHLNITHNKFNYVYYLFYLRRKQRQQFNIEQYCIWQQLEQDNQKWIPQGTSLLKKEKQDTKKKQKQHFKEECYEHYLKNKLSQIQKLKQKMDFVNNQIYQQKFNL